MLVFGQREESCASHAPLGSATRTECVVRQCNQNRVPIDRNGVRSPKVVKQKDSGL